MPFEEHSVDYIYSSHMIGFSFPIKESVAVMEGIYRVLKTGGCLRLSLTEDIRKSKSYPVDNYSTDNNAFTYNDLYLILNGIGFERVERSGYQLGHFPDIDIIDDYTPDYDNIRKKIDNNYAGTMYVNAYK